ncbi:MAG: twin-arginine translocase subunit TatB [Gammaproteobacteria bacterium]|nr:twin-arginine translocase subunit TatB [Gammaproteobacteria bacterium]
MLEGSFWELALIFVLALVVFGPERLPGLAHAIGRWVGRARAVVRNLSEQIDRELAVEEIRKTAAAARHAVRDPLKDGTGAAGDTAAADAPGTVKRDPDAR